MSPRYCAKHGWHDGACAAGKPALTRFHLTQRLAVLDNVLGDDEEGQSLGFYRLKELEAERAALRVLREAMH